MAKSKKKAASNKLDFTKLRLGTVTQRWTYIKKDGTTCIGERKIAKCGKCGKKGELTVHNSPSSGHKGYSVTHKSHIVEPIPGFPMNMVDEYCEYADPACECDHCRKRKAEATQPKETTDGFDRHVV